MTNNKASKPKGNLGAAEASAGELAAKIDFRSRFYIRRNAVSSAAWRSAR
jgi:hypothetical protein